MDFVRLCTTADQPSLRVVEDDVFVAALERMVELLQSLSPHESEPTSALDKLKIMDELVKIIGLHPRTKFELQLSETLPE